MRYPVDRCADSFWGFITAEVHTLQRPDSTLESLPDNDAQNPGNQMLDAPDVLTAASLNHHDAPRKSPTPFNFVTGISLERAMKPIRL